NQPFGIYAYFKRFTMDTIWSYGFGLDTVIGFDIFFHLQQKFIDEEPSKWIVKQAYQLIDKHEKVGQTNRTDLMQLMLGSASKDDVIQVRYSDFYQTTK
ncbi:unnamed protein product, partial [Rotaria sp. Silwood1]